MAESLENINFYRYRNSKPKTNNSSPKEDFFEKKRKKRELENYNRALNYYKNNTVSLDDTDISLKTNIDLGYDKNKITIPKSFKIPDKTSKPVQNDSISEDKPRQTLANINTPPKKKNGLLARSVSYLFNATGNKDLQNISERIDNQEIGVKDAAKILMNGVSKKIDEHRDLGIRDSDAEYVDWNKEIQAITNPLSKYKALAYPDFLTSKKQIIEEVKKRENQADIKAEENFINDLVKHNKTFPYARKIPNTVLRSEVIPLNGRTATYRDSKDHTPVENTSGSIVTFFGGNDDTFLPYDKNSKYPTHDGYFNANFGYVGLSDKDSIKVSPNVKDFENGNWKIRKIPYHDVIDFNEENGMPKIGQYDPQNPGNDVPLIKATRNGKQYNAYLPILTKKSITNFGGAHGGQVLMQFGDKTFYVSGSIDKIHRTFNKMKNHYKTNQGRIYLLDNGTFNYGLKPTGNRVDSNTHRNYSLLNTYGGDAVFLYNK